MSTTTTTCPNCQTQFAVTKKQLSQYSGKVRCGHCLHVFDATQFLVKAKTKSTASKNKTLVDASVNYEDDPTNIIKNAQDTLEKSIGTEFEADEDEDFAISETIDYSTLGNHFGVVTDDHLGETKPNQISANSPENLSNLAKSIPKKYSANKSFSWLSLLVLLFLVLAAIAQALYFLRDEIAIYYPQTKPYLEQACAPIGCSIHLPKKIDFIVIDDSDIQEDPEYTGLIRLSSALINQAGFAQAYPNIELTLTDADDQPKLRRTFKPIEYLPKNTNIDQGLAAGEELKLKLAISAQGEIVSGYRLFVTY